MEVRGQRERSSRGKESKERNRPRGAVHFTVLDSKAGFYQAGHKSNRGEIWGEEGRGIWWNDRAERNCWIHCLLRVLYVLRRLLISPSFFIPFSWQRKASDEWKIKLSQHARCSGWVDSMSEERDVSWCATRFVKIDKWRRESR